MPSAAAHTHWSSAPGRRPGTSTGFGNYINFEAITVDPGASWVLAGNIPLGNGVVLTDHGTLTVTGSLTATGAAQIVVDPATLIDTGYIGVPVTLGNGSYLSISASATVANPAGVAVYATGSTIVDAGTISGTAISFGQFSTNLLKLLPGAALIGEVYVPHAGTNTLELNSAAATGTVSGSEFSGFANFAAVTVDPGASWVLAGNEALGNGVLTDHGTLTVTGSLTTTATAQIVVDPATLINTGFIGAPMTLGAGSYLSNRTNATIANAGGVAVYATGSVTVTNSGTISGIGAEGIYLRAGGTLTNTGGLIEGSFGSVLTSSGASATISNSGTIEGNANVGIDIQGNGNVTNSGAGLIQGYQGGLDILGAGALVTNSGTIQAAGTSF